VSDDEGEKMAEPNPASDAPSVPSNVIKLEIIHGGGGAPPGGPGGPGGDDGAGAIVPVFASEDALAAQLSTRLDDGWRHAAGAWFRWDGKRWEQEKTRLCWDIAREVCREASVGIADPRLALKVASKGTIYAAVSLAEADRRHATVITAFDADPWLLNTPDGIVDLKSGQLRPHDPAALMTRIAGAGPLAEGGCPIFLRYLNEATGGDLDYQRYLQRVAGYCLTGSIEEHCFFFFHGPGGSGKTTFLLVLQDLLGGYAINAPMNTFTVSHGERHPTEIARMRGARLVTASEVEEGMRWDEAKLKAITGGDTMTGRYMRADFFDFDPEFKLAMAGNHRPRMRSADDGMKRRLHLDPFSHKPAVADKQLREKLRGELGAILRWALEGLAEWRLLGGLHPPAIVTRATEEYFEQENTLGRWIDDRCQVPEPGEDPALYWADKRELYRNFVEWAKEVGEFVIPQRLFVEKLAQMPRITWGLHSRTRRAGFSGLRLPASTPDLPGIEPDLLRSGGPDRGRREVRANDVPLEPIDDPGDDYDR
jgi:P4 family phage/plasmid primase-like protien